MEKAESERTVPVSSASSVLRDVLFRRRLPGAVIDKASAGWNRSGIEPILGKLSVFGTRRADFR